jgi:hypothetical protein
LRQSVQEGGESPTLHSHLHAHAWNEVKEKARMLSMAAKENGGKNGILEPLAKFLSLSSYIFFVLDDILGFTCLAHPYRGAPMNELA